MLRKKNIEFNSKFSSKQKIDFYADYDNIELTICPVIKRGRVREVFIYGHNKKSKYYYYVSKKAGWSAINFGNVTTLKNNIESPRIWKTLFSENHKCMAYEITLPLQYVTLEFIDCVNDLAFIWD